MKRARLNFWDFSVAGVLLILGFSQVGVAILLAVIAFLLYMLVRIQFASANNDTTSSSLGIPASEGPVNEGGGGAVKPIELLQKQLAEAEAEEVEAFKEFRRWETPWYEKEWLKAMEKSQRLAEELSWRKNLGEGATIVEVLQAPAPIGARMTERAKTI